MKRLNKGSVASGIYGIIFCIVFIVISITIFSHVGGLFVLFGIFFIGTAVFILIQSIRNLQNGLSSNEVKRKGTSSTGMVKELTKHHHSSASHNGHIGSSYTTFHVIYEYSDELGNLQEAEEQISRKQYDALYEGFILPLLVYKERAIIDKTKFN